MLLKRTTSSKKRVLIPEGRPNPGIVHTIAMSGNEMPTIYRIEIQTLAGTGKLLVSGPLSREPVRIAFDYFKAHASRVSGSIRA